MLSLSFIWKINSCHGQVIDSVRSNFLSICFIKTYQDFAMQKSNVYPENLGEDNTFFLQSLPSREYNINIKCCTKMATTVWGWSDYIIDQN